MVLGERALLAAQIRCTCRLRNGNGRSVNGRAAMDQNKQAE
jgi:hypothetical protein